MCSLKTISTEHKSTISAGNPSTQNMKSSKIPENLNFLKIREFEIETCKYLKVLEVFLPRSRVGGRVLHQIVELAPQFQTVDILTLNNKTSCNFLLKIALNKKIQFTQCIYPNLCIGSNYFFISMISFYTI